MGCPICGSDEFPHSHQLATVYNARIFCPDGSRHKFVTRRGWLRKREHCVRCGEPRQT